MILSLNTSHSPLLQFAPSSILKILMEGEYEQCTVFSVLSSAAKKCYQGCSWSRAAGHCAARHQHGAVQSQVWVDTASPLSYMGCVIKEFEDSMTTILLYQNTDSAPVFSAVPLMYPNGSICQKCQCLHFNAPGLILCQILMNLAIISIEVCPLSSSSSS